MHVLDICHSIRVRQDEEQKERWRVTRRACEKPGRRGSTDGRRTAAWIHRWRATLGAALCVRAITYTRCAIGERILEFWLPCCGYSTCCRWISRIRFLGRTDKFYFARAMATVRRVHVIIGQAIKRARSLTDLGGRCFRASPLFARPRPEPCIS